MSIIVENGTGVDNANSFITVAEARTYATNRGFSLPVEDSEVEVLITKAFDYIETQEFKGKPVYPFIITWPRLDVFVQGSLVPSDLIPKAIKEAQSLLVIEGSNTELQPTITEGEVIKQKVDVIEIEYNPTGESFTPVFTKVNALLKPYQTYNLGEVTVSRK